MTYNAKNSRGPALRRGSGSVRVVAWILVVVVIVLAAFLGYSLYAAELKATVRGVQVLPATERMEEFSALRLAVEEQALRGTLFQQGPLGNAEEYEFHVYTVDVRNNGFFQADWVRLDVQPEPGDMLQPEQESASVLIGMSTGALQVNVLAERGSNTARQFALTYFILGSPYSVRIAQP